MLPIDPSTDVPAGYTEDQRDQPGGFMGDPDIFDTWATSSLTPQIAGGWEEDGDLFDHVFPMDMRPQGHDIIRTWLFSTITRSHHEFGCAPWKHAALSGWILDPDRKKMSKSKGNVVTPMDLFETVRHRCSAVLVGVGPTRGRHRVFRRPDEGRPQARQQAAQRQQVRAAVRGRRRGTSSLDDGVTDPIDRSMLAKLDGVIADATAAFEAFDYARALERTEAFFWWFCDNYVELVKGRTYDEQRPDGGRLGQARPARGAVVAPTTARPGPAVRDRGSLELVERHEHPRRDLAGTVGRLPPGGDASADRPDDRGAHARSAGPRPRPRAANAPRSRRS